MDNTKVNELLKKYTEGLASEEEKQELLTWYRMQAYQDAVFPEDEDDIRERMLLRLTKEINPSKKKTIFYRRWKIAAVLAILTSIALYFIPQHTEKTRFAQNASKKNHILPGSNKAVLILSDGSEVVLTDAKNGHLTTQGNATITKAADGQIVYKDLGVSLAAAARYNTIKTPNGGQYEVILPDGTHVWLNAASSITYPTVFSGKERRVRLVGEAYFEVVKNRAKPFMVNVNDQQEIEVLGTHFNIEGYSDDLNIKTTLIEGSVKLNYQRKSVILKPGELAVNDIKGNISVKQADIDEVMAWRNGLFVFNDENITDAMKKAARWYDIDVAYEGNVAKKRLGGTVSRYKSINDLLNNISKTGGIHYRIEGRRVILMN